MRKLRDHTFYVEVPEHPRTDLAGNEHIIRFVKAEVIIWKSGEFTFELSWYTDKGLTSFPVKPRLRAKANVHTLAKVREWLALKVFDLSRVTQNQIYEGIRKWVEPRIKK
jgi:hypothetical protein